MKRNRETAFLKYYDTEHQRDLMRTLTLTSDSLCLVPPGDGASQRVGLAIVVRTVNIRGYLRGPVGSTQGTMARILLIQDRQSNGRSFNLAEFLQDVDDPFISFINMDHSRRFNVLVSKVIHIPKQGANVGSFAFFELTKRLRMPVFFDHTRMPDVIDPASSAETTDDDREDVPEPPPAPTPNFYDSLLPALDTNPSDLPRELRVNAMFSTGTASDPLPFPPHMSTTDPTLYKYVNGRLVAYTAQSPRTFYLYSADLTSFTTHQYFSRALSSSLPTFDTSFVGFSYIYVSGDSIGGIIRAREETDGPESLHEVTVSVPGMVMTLVKPEPITAGHPQAGVGHYDPDADVFYAIAHGSAPTQAPADVIRLRVTENFAEDNHSTTSFDLMRVGEIPLSFTRQGSYPIEFYKGRFYFYEPTNNDLYSFEFTLADARTDVANGDPLDYIERTVRLGEIPRAGRQSGTVTDIFIFSDNLAISVDYDNRVDRIYLINLSDGVLTNLRQPYPPPSVLEGLSYRLDVGGLGSVTYKLPTTAEVDVGFPYLGIASRFEYRGVTYPRPDSFVYLNPILNSRYPNPILRRYIRYPNVITDTIPPGDVPFDAGDFVRYPTGDQDVDLATPPGTVSTRSVNSRAESISSQFEPYEGDDYNVSNSTYEFVDSVSGVDYLGETFLYIKRNVDGVFYTRRLRNGSGAEEVKVDSRAGFAERYPYMEATDFISNEMISYPNPSFVRYRNPTLEMRYGNPLLRHFPRWPSVDDINEKLETGKAPTDNPDAGNFRHFPTGDEDTDNQRAGDGVDNTNGFLTRRNDLNNQVPYFPRNVDNIEEPVVTVGDDHLTSNNLLLLVLMPRGTRDLPEVEWICRIRYEDDTACEDYTNRY